MKNLNQLEQWALIAATFISAVSARAGNEIANGGEAVVCFSSVAERTRVYSLLQQNVSSPNPTAVFQDTATQSSVISVEMLDYYLYRRPVGFPPTPRDLVSENTPYYQLAGKLIDRLATKSSFADYLRRAALDLPFANWHPIPLVPVVRDSRDLSYSAIPDTCLIVQLARLHDQNIGYDQWLFDHLDNINRTSLILHEYLNRVFVNTRETRDPNAIYRMVGLLISNTDFLAISGADINDQYTRPFFDWQHGRLSCGYDSRNGTVWTYDPGIRQESDLYDPSISVGVTAYPNAGHVVIHGQVLAPKTEEWIGFFQDGSLSFATFATTTPYIHTVGSSSLPLKYAQFSPDGTLIRGFAADDAKIELDGNEIGVSRGEVVLPTIGSNPAHASNVVEFYPNGIPKYFSPEGIATLSFHGETLPLDGGLDLFFSPSGHLIAATVREGAVIQGQSLVSSHPDPHSFGPYAIFNEEGILLRWCDYRSSDANNPLAQTIGCHLPIH